MRPRTVKLKTGIKKLHSITPTVMSARTNAMSAFGKALGRCLLFGVKRTSNEGA
jgi:hypothetical protein